MEKGIVFPPLLEAPDVARQVLQVLQSLRVVVVVAFLARFANIRLFVFISQSNIQIINADKLFSVLKRTFSLKVFR